jgi:hypothetical protein
MHAMVGEKAVKEVIQRRAHGRFSAMWSFGNRDYIREVVSLEQKKVNNLDLQQTETQTPDDMQPLTETIIEVPSRKTVVQFFQDDLLLFEKDKNSYHTEDDDFMLLEWFDVLGETRFIFNEHHGCIGVYQAFTGDLIHESDNNDMFITKYQFFDDRTYLYLAGWMWQPFSMRTILHIPSLLTMANYEPIDVTTIDVENPASLNPGINLFGCSSCAELVERHDKIAAELGKRKFFQEFMKNRKSHNLLNLFLESKEVSFQNNSRTIMQTIVDSDDIKSFTVETLGGISGELLDRYNWKLFLPMETHWRDKITDDQKLILKFRVANTLFSSFVDSLPFPEVYLIFKVQSNVGSLKITIRHVLEEDLECKAQMRASKFPDEMIDQRCKISAANPMTIDVDEIID